MTKCFSELFLDFYYGNKYNSIIEALTDYCEKHSIEFEDLESLLDSNVKKRIRKEGIKLNLLKKEKERISFV